MSKYGFNENELRKTVVDMIDKDGFHKKVVIENGSGSSSSNGLEENIYFVEDETNNEIGVTVIIDTSKYDSVDANTSINTSYVYFGDIIQDSDIHAILDDVSVIDNASELNLIGEHAAEGSEFLEPRDSDNHAIVFRIYTNSSFPENWKELKAHCILTYTYDASGTSEARFVQVHQK